MYLVVEFLEDPKVYSVISVENVVDGSVRANVTDYLGKATKVMWGKKNFDAVLRGQGSKREMNVICNSLAESAAVSDGGSNDNPQQNEIVVNKISEKRSKRAKKSRDIASVLAKRSKSAGDNSSTFNEPNVSENVLDAITDNNLYLPELPVNTREHVNQADDPGDLQECIKKLQAKIEKLKRRKLKLKNTVDEQQKTINSLEQKLQVSSSSSKKVELVAGSGVYLRATKIAAAKLGSKTPAILSRKLFRFLFTTEEAKGCSILGRQCNANKGSIALPSVDPAKRDAIIEFTLSTFNLKPSFTKGLNEYQFQKGKILASLGKLLREEYHKTP